MEQLGCFRGDASRWHCGRCIDGRRVNGRGVASQCWVSLIMSMGIVLDVLRVGRTAKLFTILKEHLLCHFIES